MPKRRHNALRLAPSWEAKVTNSCRSDSIERSCHGMRGPSLRGLSMAHQVLPISPNGCPQCPRSVHVTGEGSWTGDGVTLLGRVKPTAISRYLPLSAIATGE